MTTQTLTATAVSVPETRSSFFDVVRTGWRHLKYRNHQRLSARHLSTLSDHHLRDIGIHRSEINSMVYGNTVEPRYYTGQ